RRRFPRRMAAALPGGRRTPLPRRRPLRPRGRRRRGHPAGQGLPETSPPPGSRAMSEPPAVNIAAPLRVMAEVLPHTLAIAQPHGRDRQGCVRYRHLTFRELHAESDCLASGLEQVGVRRGTRTVLMVTPGLEFFALTFALFKVGAVVVLIDAGMSVKNLGVCLREAEPQAFVGIPRAHLARVRRGWARQTARTFVTVGPRLGWGGVTLEQVRRQGAKSAAYQPAPTRADETAAVLFTSGSTGVAKGAVYTHGTFA